METGAHAIAFDTAIKLEINELDDYNDKEMTNVEGIFQQIIKKLNLFILNICFSLGEESDICRICRCEGTKEDPLFFPCLCKGSIKYIHQECYFEWLKYSKTTCCEVCKHRILFELSGKKGLL